MSEESTFSCVHLSDDPNIVINIIQMGQNHSKPLISDVMSPPPFSRVEVPRFLVTILPRSAKLGMIFRGFSRSSTCLVDPINVGLMS